VRDDRDLDTEHRRGDRRPEQVLVALVVRMRDERHHAGDQLGPGGLDVDGAPRTIGGRPVEVHAVVVAVVLLRLQLGLRDRGLERDVPEGRRLLEVGLAPGEVAQESALTGQLRLGTDGRVVLVPVDREAEGAPQRLEDLLVLLDQLLAELDEVGPADRHLALGVGLLGRGEVVLVGERRVAADAEVVLHPPLGRQPVVVPAHGVEHGLAAHPLEPRDQVGVGVGEDVPDVQRPAHGGRRGVDRVDVLARLGAVEGVGLVAPPALDPLLLEALEGRLVGYDDGAGGRRRLLGLVLLGLGHGRNPRSQRACAENDITRDLHG
jgi:hypothetical protein